MVYVCCPANRHRVKDGARVVAGDAIVVGVIVVTLQLYGTLATHYYLNLDIPHLEEFRSQYKAQQEVNPPLAISKEKCHDLSQEKLRNRFPLSTLMQQNPVTYILFRFTCEGTVIGINTTRDWYYESCSSCTAKVIDGADVPQSAISDGTATGQFTFFTPNADVVTGADCTKLVNLYDTPSPRNFPPEILNL
ncbi:nucleic acid-binding, OB-fold protein [Tanacetum coccineum]|uniref:Nucleic acid-binding, OB-fold protein n=1 Tax=Tanacetum coccineum TaxID=301880 RepID=A0ABQ5I246_9ASTR